MILLVEDQENQLNYLMGSINMIDPTLEMISATTIKEAEDQIAENEISAFFLDVQLPDGSGIDFAKKLRTIKKYHLTPIIFITGLATKELDAFRSTHCYDYILKPFSRERIARIVEHLFLESGFEYQDDKTVMIELKAYRQNLYLKDIVYIESKLRKLFIVTKREVIPYKVMSLSKFLKTLDDRFVMIHQSFAINKYYVESVDWPMSSVKMRNVEEEIPIGRSYKGKVKEVDELY